MKSLIKRTTLFVCFLFLALRVIRSSKKTFDDDDDDDDGDVELHVLGCRLT